MTAVPAVESLPIPPNDLAFGHVRLRLDRVVPGEPERDFVPYYHFRIVTADEVDVGHINFRVGETEHVRLCAGHVGFEIAPASRGHGYALQACRAISPFVRAVSQTVTLTCDPDNTASRRTIERLNVTFVDVIYVPLHDPHYQRGSRRKMRYRWKP